MNEKKMKNKMIYPAENAAYVYDRIEETSAQTGVSQSRIMENCLLCGFGVLYGDKTDAEKIIEIMKGRHGNFLDTKRLFDFLIGNCKSTR